MSYLEFKYFKINISLLYKVATQIDSSERKGSNVSENYAYPCTTIIHSLSDLLLATYNLTNVVM